MSSSSQVLSRFVCRRSQQQHRKPHPSDHSSHTRTHLSRRARRFRRRGRRRTTVTSRRGPGRPSQANRTIAGAARHKTARARSRRSRGISIYPRLLPRTTADTASRGARRIASNSTLLHRVRRDLRRHCEGELCRAFAGASGVHVGLAGYGVDVCARGGDEFEAADGFEF
jgi:hypothetical protein